MVPAREPVRVVMIGPDRAVMGGISSVIRAYCEAGFPDSVAVTVLASHVDGSPVAKALVASHCLVKLLVGLVSRRWDVVHLHSSKSGSFIRKSIFLRLAKLFRLPVVLHVHTGRIGALTAGRSALATRVKRSSLRLADRVIVLSAESRELIEQAVEAERVAVIPNGVPIPPVPSDPGTGPILYLGLVSDAKGTFDLIEAFAGSSAEGLVIAGNGELDRARRRVAELDLGARVTIHEWVDPVRRDALIDSASVFALVSHTEGMPMSLLEAMAAGLPAVVTSVGAMPDVVETDRSGLVVAPRDVGAITAALDRLAASPELRRTMGGAARDRIIREFGVEASLARVVDIWLELAQRAGPEPDAVG